MSRRTWIGTAVGVASLIVLGSAWSFAQRTKQSDTLTAQDYIDIQQLFAVYAQAVDSGAEEGWARARCFTTDGVFKYGEPDKLTTVSGQKAIAAYAADRLKRTPHPGMHRHYILTQVVKPAPGGAQGRAYFFIGDVAGGENGGPRIPTTVGIYTYNIVKTTEGWRFKILIAATGAFPVT